MVAKAKPIPREANGASGSIVPHEEWLRLNRRKRDFELILTVASGISRTEFNGGAQQAKAHG
jgi:hypothetical protein